jgi:integrase
MRLRRRKVYKQGPDGKRAVTLPHWYADVTVRRPDGTQERIQKSTGCTDRRAAEDVARQWERDAARDPADRAAQTATLRDALNLLSRHLDAETKARARARTSDPHARDGMSPDTAAFYRKKAGQLVRRLGNDTPLREITTGRVRTYWQDRQAEGASAHTIDKEVGTLRVTLHLAAEHGLWSGDLRALKPQGLSANYKPRGRWLKPAEVELLATELPPGRWAAVAYACATGAESSALFRAERDDVNLRKSAVRIRGDKTAYRARVIPIVLDVCRDLLKRALKLADGEAPKLFRPWPGMRWDITKACDKLKIERCSANDFRRTFAQWHHDAGISNDVLKDAMGHSTTKMLDQVYARTGPEQLAALMRAQINAPPRKR